MVNRFFLDGICSRDFGILISEPTSYGTPAADVEFQSVPGRSGDLILTKKRYENISITYPANMFSRDPSQSMRRIAAWLNATREYRKLYDTYNPGYYRYAAFASTIDPTVTGPLVEFNITFNCKPFLYAFSGDDDIEITSAMQIYNPEAFESRPIITAYGTGAGEIYVNDRIINIDDIDEYITIDTDTQNAYKGTANCNDAIDSADVPLAPAQNSIAFDGDITKIVIKPRWRCL